MSATPALLQIGRHGVAALALLHVLGCSDGVERAAPGVGDPPTATVVEPPTEAPGSATVSDASPEQAVAPRGPRVVFVGTSLTAGYGLGDPTVEAWPARVGDLARAAGTPIEVVNAGVSGDTSAGGLRRIVPLLTPAPAAVVLELGANDGLRGLRLGDLRTNLDAAVDSIARYAPDAQVLVVRMEAPRNLGPEYVAGFSEVFDQLHARPEVTPMPFILEGVAGIPDLNQADGIHPIARGHTMMAELAWPSLEQALAASGAAR